MADPVFLLQLVDAQTGKVLIQKDLRAELRAGLQARGVGFLRSEAHVLADFDAAWIAVDSGLRKAARSFA